MRAKQIKERSQHTFDNSFSPSFERKLYELGIREYAWDNEKEVFQIKLNNHPELKQYLEVKNEWEFWKILNGVKDKKQTNPDETMWDEISKTLWNLYKKKYFVL